MRQYFEPKDPDEQVNLLFDFTDSLAGDTIAGTPEVACTTDAGTDASPGDVLNGTATVVTGTVVVQPVRAGVAGCDYRVEVRASTTGSSPTRKLVLVGFLPVREI